MKDVDDNEPSKKKMKMESKPMTRQDFLKFTKEEIGNCVDKNFILTPKKFKTESVGYGGMFHHVIQLTEDKHVKVVMTCNSIVIGSKKWDEGEADAKDNDSLKKDKEEKIKQNTLPVIESSVMTKNEFLSLAADIGNVTLFGETFALKARKFSTGSCGWNHGKNSIIVINGKQLKMRTTLNMIVKKSKEWEEGEEIEIPSEVKDTQE
jgi:hypothetical protein